MPACALDVTPSSPRLAIANTEARRRDIERMAEFVEISMNGSLKAAVCGFVLVFSMNLTTAHESFINDLTN